MTDLISRQAAIEAVHNTIFDFFDMDKDDSDSPMTESDKRLLKLNKAVTTAIRKLPNIDVPDRKVGKWIYTEVREYPVGFNLVKCSSCDWCLHSNPREKWVLTAEDVARDFNYCPNCGAMMERSEE